MNISKFLSKALGIYLLIVSVAMFINMQQFAIQINYLVNDKALMFVVGFFTLILGILMVISHNIWQWNWRVIITLVAWLTLLEGTILITYPQLINQITIPFIDNAAYVYSGAGFDFILGLVLTYYGFRRA
jgi:hypothetical protein